MDPKEYYPFIRQNFLAIGLAAVGIILLGVGLFQLVINKNNEPEIVFEDDKEVEKPAEIVVDVGGAVINPGVYKLKSDARVVDALAQAGGLSEDADREHVEKNINLAGKMSDGLKIYIPRVGEEILADNTTSEVGSGGPVININSATSADLEQLPGVGEVTAQKIIDGRPYATSEELLDKKIVGAATFEKIKDKIAAN